jgi:hypothetical protein
MEKKEILNEVSRMSELMGVSINKNYINETIDKLLNEQNDITQKTSEKTGNPDILVDVDFFGSENEVTKYKKKNPNFDSQLSNLKNHVAYSSLLNKLDDEEKKIFYLSLFQSTRIAFLDITKKFLQQFVRKRKLKKDSESIETKTKDLYNWDADIVQGKPVKKQVNKKILDDNTISEYIEVPFIVRGANVYVDNSAKPASALLNQIDLWFTEVKQVIEQAKSMYQEVTVDCTKIEVMSSASRLRNTGEYEGKTWKQLAADRGMNVRNILIQKLTELGVNINLTETQTIYAGGDNKDGTSGPDPAQIFTLRSGKQTTEKKPMRYSKTGAEIMLGPDEKRFSVNGALLQSSEDSDQYKYCVALAELVMKTKNKVNPEDKVEPEYLFSNNYSISLWPEYETPEWNGKLKVRRQFKPSGKSFGDSGQSKLNLWAKIIGFFKRGKVGCDAYG